MQCTWCHARIIILLFANMVILSHQRYEDAKITMPFKWKFAEVLYPSEAARDAAIKRGDYVPSHVFPMTVDYYNGRWFMSGPQFYNGTPAALYEVVKYKGKDYLKPYPDWPDKTNKETLCGSIPCSVYRFHIDKCGIMWVVDNGYANLLGGSRSTLCTPKILAYDLATNKLIRRYVYPPGVVDPKSNLVSIITESYKRDCSDSIVYVADCREHGVQVYDFAKNTSWRVENRYMFAYPKYCLFKSNGQTWIEPDGVFSMALGPENQPDRKLYFHSYAGVRESWTTLRVMKNATLAKSASVQINGFNTSPGTRSGQCMSKVITPEGVMIYANVITNELVCWNINKPFTRRNQYVLKRDNENFQYITQIQMHGYKLYMISTKLQNFRAGITDTPDIKYRVMVVHDYRKMYRNTPCDPYYRGHCRG